MFPNTANKNLHAAKNAQKDEFYTQLEDIENELNHYTRHFTNKMVYCNCDDPRISNFFRYFVLIMKNWGLKSLLPPAIKTNNTIYLANTIASKLFI
jgi:hypothetical protein